MTKKRTFFLITFFSLLLALIVAVSFSVVITSQKEEKELRITRSIFNTKKSGYAAWLDVLKKTGLPHEIWKKSFADLHTTDKESTMLIASPYMTTGRQALFSPPEIKRLLRWVNEGNTLIFMDDFASDSSFELMNRLNIKVKIPGKKEPTAIEEKTKKKKSTKIADLVDLKFDSKYYQEEKYLFDTAPARDFNYNTGEISSNSSVRIQSDFMDSILKDRKGTIFAKRRYGKGQIYILTIPDFIDNSYLYEKEDNYQFFTNIISQSPKPLYINEYVHGYMRPLSPLSYYENTLLNPIFYQLFFLLVVFIWSKSRRFGKIRPLEEESRANNLEYLTAIVNLYKKAGLTGAVLLPIYHHFKLNLCKDLKISSQSTPEEILQAVNKHYPPEDKQKLSTLIDTFETSGKKDALNKQDMVDLCKTMNSFRLKG